MEFIDSDTIRLALPSGIDLANFRVACSRFGTIERAHHVDEQVSNEAEVVFFDVREARNAATTLKPLGCTVLPQPKLNRDVMLPESIKLEVQDLVAVRNLQNENHGEGSYTVKFFDARVAARYFDHKEKVTPAASTEGDVIDPRPQELDSPPGLYLPLPTCFQNTVKDAPAQRSTQICWKKRGARLGKETKSRTAGRTCQRLSQGLQSATVRPTSMESKGTRWNKPAEASGEFDVKKPSKACKPEYIVRVCGLPRALLSDDMMLVMLQQANIEHDLLGYTVRPEGLAGHGEAFVVLATPGSSERCARHFNGCRWDSSGVAVTAEILGPEFVKRGSQSAAAPVFMPSFAGRSPDAFGQALSTKARAFVPKRAAFAPAASHCGSDQSTDTGDSGSEDKDVGTAVAEFDMQPNVVYSF